MKKKNIFYKVTFLLIIIIATSCSTDKRYEIAKSLYLQSNYVPAIEHYDDFINKTLDGALATKAELEKSECYYQLGLYAYAKKNWKLANNLFYLANSLKADEKMDNCYYELAQIAMKENDIKTVLEHYDYILTYLTTSELIPEILYNRIKISVDLDNKQMAFDDYHILWNQYPENEFTKKAEPFIDRLLPFYIEEVIALQHTGDYETSLEILINLSLLPSSYKKLLIEEISNVYLLMGDREMNNLNYSTGLEFYQRAINYDFKQESIINNKLETLCQEFIAQGNNLIESDQLDEAIKVYEKAFLIIPEYPDAVAGIEKVEITKQNYITAQELIDQALILEKEKKFAEALKLYKQSAVLRNTDWIREKVFQTQNIIEAENNPIEFAKFIIRNYKNGKVAERIYALENDMITIHGEEFVRSTGWKVLYSFGKYKYEVRYDIVTPEENFYFIWRLDLITREVTPLNKITEKILEK